MSVAYFKFDNYKLPYNPKNINVYTERTTDGKCTIISCSGELHGKDCNLYLNQIESLYKSKKQGMLHIPESGVFKAELLKFDYSFTSTPNLVTYAFTFRQITKQDNSENAVYIAGENETLWSICKKLGCSIDTLVKLNEGKLNSYVLSDGDRVIVPLGMEVVVLDNTQ